MFPWYLLARDRPLLSLRSFPPVTTQTQVVLRVRGTGTDWGVTRGGETTQTTSVVRRELSVGYLLTLHPRKFSSLVQLGFSLPSETLFSKSDLSVDRPHPKSSQNENGGGFFPGLLSSSGESLQSGVLSWKGGRLFGSLERPWGVG